MNSGVSLEQISRLKILVVDDEARIVKLVRDYLERAGFEVIAAPDGEAALRLARRQQPDLIVLDVMLPKLDGYSVITELRKHLNSH